MEAGTLPQLLMVKELLLCQLKYTKTHKELLLLTNSSCHFTHVFINPFSGSLIFKIHDLFEN